MKKGTFLWLGRMGLPLSLALCHIYPLAAQNKVILPDSIPWMLSDSLMRGDILQIGYATGDRRTVAGSVDQISEKRVCYQEGRPCSTPYVSGVQHPLPEVMTLW